MSCANARIIRVEGSTFRTVNGDLSYVIWLNLVRNQISILEDGVFDKLTSLTSLNLGRNRLRYIGADAFRYNLDLVVLSLNNNPIKVTVFEFGMLPRLRRLDLSFCKQFHTLDKVSFETFYENRNDVKKRKLKVTGTNFRCQACNMTWITMMTDVITEGGKCYSYVDRLTDWAGKMKGQWGPEMIVDIGGFTKDEYSCFIRGLRCLRMRASVRVFVCVFYNAHVLYMCATMCVCVYCYVYIY